MRKIISVSRRTDVPAFYSEWFLKRLDYGFAGWENPFGGQKYLVSLALKDVIAFVFWSKNYRPFLDRALPRLRESGHNCLFQYTITGLPREFESEVVELDDAIDSFRTISDKFSPEHVFWRYDPIVLSDRTDKLFHLERFDHIARRLSGFTGRCYFSYAIQYGKVERNYKRFSEEQGVKFFDPDTETKIHFANQLADIANNYSIEMYTCCGDYLISNKIKKAHCVDGELISKLFFHGDWSWKWHPTRKECGCTESTDIGKYDTCPHGCIYCYANIHKEKAQQMYKSHDPESPFLGYSKSDSKRFLAQIKPKSEEPLENVSPQQLSFTGF